MRSARSKLLAFRAGLLMCFAAFGQPLPMANRPADAGFASKRLERVRQAIVADVESKRVPGAVLLLARNGKIVTYDAIGFQDRAGQTPMKKDSIFRIASMTKPI